MARPLLRGLYAITPTALCLDPPRLLRDTEAALAGGARLIQYRDKTGDHDRRRRSVEALRELCERHGAGLIVNDDVALAAETGAHGVHIGLEDGPLEKALARLGPAAIVGVTCANSPERARAASEGGAAYVALGAFFVSRTKPDALVARLEHLRAVRTSLSLPICVIGGITAANGRPLVEAGADLVAASEGIFGAADVRRAARAYAALFHLGGAQATTQIGSE